MGDKTSVPNEENEFVVFLRKYAKIAFREKRRKYVIDITASIVDNPAFVEQITDKEKEERKRIASLILTGRYSKALSALESPDLQFKYKKEAIESLRESTPYVSVNYLVGGLKDETMYKKRLAAIVNESRTSHARTIEGQINEILESSLFDTLSEDWKKKHKKEISLFEFSKEYVDNSFNKMVLPVTKRDVDETVINSFLSLENRIYKPKKNSFKNVLNRWKKANPIPAEVEIYAI